MMEIYEPVEQPTEPMCGRCYAFVERVFPPKCNEKPELLLGQPLGMYHCPDCGAMLIAGIPHPHLCQLCVDLKHPAYDDLPEGTQQ